MKKLTSLNVDPDGNLSSRTKHVRQPKTRFRIKELKRETWPDFERIVEKHNGVWGGCWCTAFHLKRSEEEEWAGKHRDSKRSLFERIGPTRPSYTTGRMSLGGVSADPPSNFRAE